MIVGWIDGLVADLMFKQFVSRFMISVSGMHVFW